MSASTRCAACCFSGVSLPTILVRTGPAAGNDSVIVSDWNRTTASVIMGWNTPDAPFQGSVRSSIWRPSSLSPSVYAFSQSLREARSFSIAAAKSLAIESIALEDMSSAKLAEKSSAASSSAWRSSSSNPGPLIFTSSGSTISISISGSPRAKSSMPCGC